MAVLHQAAPPPGIGGQVKPMKAGGYRDSGADIAYALRRRSVPVITPQRNPNPALDEGWTFPDDAFEDALEEGATVLWTNTILYPGHPIDRLRAQVRRVGQETTMANWVEDKRVSSEWLAQVGVPRPRQLVTDCRNPVSWPGGTWVAKPIRGRGSQGVRWVDEEKGWETVCRQWPMALFGPGIILEEAILGSEITITVLPPGRYQIGGQAVVQDRHWALPPVERYAHVEHIMPYNGDVPVSQNSRAVSLETTPIRKAMGDAERVASLLKARAALRLDARESHGDFQFFDVNMKPNMTGPGRPGRDGAISLVGLAAEAIGWDYGDLVVNLAAQAW